MYPRDTANMSRWGATFPSPFDRRPHVCRSDESVTDARSSCPMCTVIRWWRTSGLCTGVMPGGILSAEPTASAHTHTHSMYAYTAESHKNEVKLYNYTTVKFYISKFIFNDCEAITSMLPILCLRLCTGGARSGGEGRTGNFKVERDDTFAAGEMNIVLGLVVFFFGLLPHCHLQFMLHNSFGLNSTGI